MKKLLSIILAVCVISTLLVMPVSAADTTLFTPPTVTTIISASDFSSLTQEDLADSNVTIGGANIYLYTPKSGVIPEKAMSVSEDGTTLKATASSDRYVQSSGLVIAPENVPSNVIKATYTVKIKPSYANSDGTTKYGNGSSYMIFNFKGKTASGTTGTQRMSNWYPKTSEAGTAKFERGAGAGANNYTSGDFTPVMDADGFYNLKFVNVNGNTQYAYIYDMNNNDKLIGHHQYASSNEHYVTDFAQKVDIIFNGTSTSAYADQQFGIELKDLTATYETGLGSATVGNGMAVSYDEATNTYAAKNIVGAQSNPYVKFQTAAQTTGYVVSEFDIKSTTAKYGTGSYSCSYYLRVGSAGYGIAFGDGQLGAFNTGNYTYKTAAAGGSTSTGVGNGPRFTVNDGWYSLKVVATKSTESGTWSYAVYDKNGSTNQPLLVKPTTATTFDGLHVGYYIDSTSRAASAADKTKPNFERTVHIKDFRTYSTDSYPEYTHYGSSSYYTSSLSTSTGLKVVDATTVRYDQVIYMNTLTSGKAIAVALDAEGKELGKTEKVLGNGLYEYTAINPFAITVADSSKVASAKLYIQNGSTWVTEPYVEPVAHEHSWAETWSSDDTNHWKECTAEGCDVTENSAKEGYGAHVYDDKYDAYCNTCNHFRVAEPVPQPIEATFTSTAAFGDANGVEALRFYFTPSFESTVKDFGAYIVPFSIFEESADSDAVRVLGGKTIESGKTFAADLIGIPEAAYDTTIVAVPFVVSTDDLYTYGTRIQAVVNELK